MYAIIKISGKQFKATEGARVRVPRQNGDVGTKLTFDNVLLLQNGDDTQIVKSTGKTYREIFKEIIISDEFNYKIDRTWVAFHEVRSKWVSDKFVNTFGPRREVDGPIEDYHKHIACALQNRLEEIILYQLKKCKEKFNLKKLCFAGGVALKCSLNGKILESELFDEIFERAR